MAPVRKNASRFGHSLMEEAIADQDLTTPCPRHFVHRRRCRASVVSSDHVEFALQWDDDSLVASLYQGCGNWVVASMWDDDLAVIKTSATAADVSSDTTEQSAGWIIDFFEDFVKGYDLNYQFRAATCRLELRLGMRVRASPRWISSTHQFLVRVIFVPVLAISIHRYPPLRPSHLL